MLKQIDWIKATLLLGMGLCILLLLREWDSFQERHLPPPSAVSTPNPAITTPSYRDELPQMATPPPKTEPAPTETSNQILQVRTNVLELQIDPQGGDLVGAKLLKHSISNKDTRPYPLLRRDQGRIYVAKSGLIGSNATDTTAGRPLFTSHTQHYQLPEGVEELVVDLHHQQGEVNLTKRFRLRRGDYLIDLEYLIDNQSNKLWKAALYAQINRDPGPPAAKAGFGLNPYVGAAITTPDSPYKKLDFKEITKKGRFQQTVETGWIALLERYFLTAWLPQPGLPVHYDLRKSPHRDLYFFGFTQPEITVPAGETGKITASFYAGPKDQYRLRDLAPHLDLTVDYGWLWWAAQPLYAILFFLQTGEVHAFNLDLQLFPGVGNWGLSIILLTVLVKLLFWPLSATSYRSMARMRVLTPKMTALRERYGDDRQAMGKELMKLYQKEKVNPLGGCLPMLMQMPIFIALYYVLLESVEIRQAPFALWITDLSVKDPWFVLPAIMGVSMWFQQRLNPPPPDPTQARVFQMMPIIFTVMFLIFPAGLVLYWTVNNLLSIAQQWVITKQIEAGKKASS